MPGVAEEAAACTWTLGACPADGDIAGLASIDPATPSARIAEIMIARPVHMIPPRQLPRPAARCTALPACTAYLRHAELFPSFRLFHAPRVTIIWLFFNNKIRATIVADFLRTMFMPSCGRMLAIRAPQGPAQLALRGAGTLAMPLPTEGALCGELTPENNTCIPNVLVVNFAPCPP
jgi:hypothetical protein